VQYLIAADEHSLVELELALTTLPMCATGRVFVEVPDASWICDLDVPSRMTLTWLDRSRRGSWNGVALTRATTAWADEMLCVEPDVRTQVVLMADTCATMDMIEHLTGQLELPHSAITC